MGGLGSWTGIVLRNAAATAGVVGLFFSGCAAVGPECPPPPCYGFEEAPACQEVPVPVQPTPVQQVPVQPTPVQPAATVYPNPIFIPIADPHCAWEQLVDVVDDYFRIESEQPARVVGNVPTLGTLTTAAEVSPTIFEPWRRDTVDRAQRVENTLQTMHRQAVIRVTPAPAQGGHWFDVAVYKRLEDAKKPDHAPAGAATFRYDDALTRVVNPITGESPTAGWIARGRDAALEQCLIADLLSRCGPAGRPAAVRGQSPE